MLRRSLRRRVDPAAAAEAAAAAAAAAAAVAYAEVAEEVQDAGAAQAEAAAALAAGVPPHVPPPPAVYPYPLSSAVTVYCTRPEHVFVGSGAIFFSNDRYTVVFCSSKLYNTTDHPFYGYLPSTGQFSVHFTDNTTKKAHVLQKNRKFKFMLLIVLESELRTRVSLSYEPVSREVVRTVGTMAGTRIHPDTKPVTELVHAVGSYTGVVLAPSCESRDVQGNLEPGHESYFIVQCAFQDFLLKRQDIDKTRKISARSLLSAPVFKRNGELLGVICTSNNYIDSMVALKVKGILSIICELCGVEIIGEHGVEAWQGALLKAAEAYIQSR